MTFDARTSTSAMRDSRGWRRPRVSQLTFAFRPRTVIVCVNKDVFFQYSLTQVISRVFALFFAFLEGSILASPDNPV